MASLYRTKDMYALFGDAYAVDQIDRLFLVPATSEREYRSNDQQYEGGSRQEKPNRSVLTEEPTDEIDHKK
jgi:hypothetical protein